MDNRFGNPYRGRYFYYTFETKDRRSWRICSGTHPLQVSDLDNCAITSWKEIPCELAEELITKYGLKTEN